MKRFQTIFFLFLLSSCFAFTSPSFCSEAAESSASAGKNLDNVYINRFISMQEDQIFDYIENFDMSQEEAPRQVSALLHHPDDDVKRKALSALCIDSSPEIVSSLSALIKNTDETLEIRFDAVDILMQLKPVAAICGLANLREEKSDDPLIDKIATDRTVVRDEISAYITLDRFLTHIIEGSPVEAYSFLGPKLERRTSPYNLEGWISPYYKRFIIHQR